MMMQHIVRSEPHLLTTPIMTTPFVDMQSTEDIGMINTLNVFVEHQIENLLKSVEVSLKIFQNNFIFKAQVIMLE